MVPLYLRRGGESFVRIFGKARILMKIFLGAGDGGELNRERALPSLIDGGPGRNSGGEDRRDATDARLAVNWR